MTIAMRSLSLLLLFVILTSSIQPTEGNDSVSLNTLEGVWVIDLRPSPDAEPYTQEFEVTQVSGNTFQGFFYGSPLEGARINPNWDQLYFAFSTKDRSFDYYHSGYLKDGKLYGVSYCPGREFVQPWTGVRK
ncbi:hypothetical protein SAMN06265375_101416 [Muriicola jejuensis]|uniref:Lipocalin-like domain-containing protein n=1 Tax=Muriicola jejuensis TaxID=504488 RepID=A0A6P0UBR2_9FLAO|nr:hypothetical protein [Muriicola jejuensis]NER10052.1 hypothetical protein [Muriicola jejuensis]SMP03397.1 hypothetical protein SAMN06265375_101416 [Muriicola jejuensis]